jgi:ATP-dependent RNA helicase DDX23/PRP28
MVDHLLLLSCIAPTLTSRDEADRMIDLGFEIDLNLILDSMPATSLSVEDSTSATADVSQLRVTSLYSATMPIQVERIARKYLRKPATITIGDAGEAAQTVQQIVEFIASDEKKKARLIDILRNGGFAAPIVSPPFICCYLKLTKYRSFSSIRSVLPMLL